MNYINEDFNEDILKKIKSQLNLIKFQLEKADTNLLEFIFYKELQNLKNKLNRNEVPQALEFVLLDRIVANLLESKINSNTLKIENLELEPMLTQITRGDVSMSYKGVGKQELFFSYINSLKKTGKKEIYRFRLVGW